MPGSSENVIDGGSQPLKRHWLRKLILGPPRDARDPKVYHRLSLVALLAWAGLGADGITSSCYGPEEAFLALGHHHYLALLLALATALTVFIISASYSQTIDLFPTGGGGYTVATTLLGETAGLVSGCALIVDYLLTVAVSISSGTDAIFSLLPMSWHWAKLWFSMFVLLILITINLRGVKESVLILFPLFMAFVVMHAWLLSYGLLSHAHRMPEVVSSGYTNLRHDLDTLGLFGLGLLFLRAFSLGGGTFTGIEAVANGLPILREPRTVTGKHAMSYMAFSLAFLAGGILACYLLFDVAPQPGMTLNAVLFGKIADNWRLGDVAIGRFIVTVTLLSEGSLLFVAAQTGFADCPRVLATMASDRWVPRRFASLSTRLVTQDGVIFTGLASAVILLVSRGNVSILVALYAINVFITFTLSQLGMSVHWWQSRRSERRWKRKLLVNGVGCILTSVILVLTVVLKFDEGGWVTLAITGMLVALCYTVRRHYDQLRAALTKLEARILPELHRAEKGEALATEDGLGSSIAVILTGGFNGLGLATLLNLHRLFRGQFKHLIFVGVGEIDSRALKGPKEIERLERSLAEDFRAYCKLASDLGYQASFRLAVSPDVVADLYRLCLEVAREHPEAVFFAGKLVFGYDQEDFITRFLHNHVALELQNMLQLQGLSLVILPSCVRSDQPAAGEMVGRTGNGAEAVRRA